MKRKDLRLLLSIGSSRALFFASIGASIFWSLLVIAHGFLIAQIIVGIIGHHPDVAKKIIFLASLLLIRSIFQSQFERWASKQAVKVKEELRLRLISSLGRYTASPGEVSTLAIKGLNSLDMYIGRFLPQMIFATTTPALVIATLFFLDPTSAFIAVITLPLIPLFGALIGKYTSVAVMKKWRELGSLAKYFEDSMRGYVTLRLFGRHKSQDQRIFEMGKKYAEETMKVLRISFLSSLVLELCATISVALIAVSIGIRLVNGSIGFASALMILILAPEVYFPLRNTAALFHASADGAEAMSSLENLFNTSDLGQGTLLEWIEWKSDYLGISIPSARICAGSALQLMGESGIGKTTFISHLLNQLNPDLVSWIPQNPVLAKGTVRDQFHYVDSHLCDEEIESLCAKVNLRLTDLPAGLDTRVGGAGEKSSHASGGQIRKIAIARALAKGSQILIADEPTADLDRESSIIVHHLLKDYVESQGALLVVSHDQDFAFAEKLAVQIYER